MEHDQRILDALDGDSYEYDLFDTVPGSQIQETIDQGAEPSLTLLMGVQLRHLFARISSFYAKLDYDPEKIVPSEEARFKADLKEEIGTLMEEGKLPPKPDLRNLFCEPSTRNPHGIYLGVEGAELMTTKQAAAYLGKSEKTLQNRRANNKGPRFIDMGGSIRYLLNDLERFRGRPDVIADDDGEVST